MDMRKIVAAIEQISNEPEPSSLDGIVAMTPEERNAELRRLTIHHLASMPHEDFNSIIEEIVKERTDHPVLPINWAGSSILGVEYGPDGKPMEKQAESMPEVKPRDIVANATKLPPKKPRVYTDEQGIIHGESEDERINRIKNQISKDFSHDEYGDPF